jgi:hypothetical protein
MLDSKDHHATSSVYDNEGCDCKHHDGKHVPIFGAGAYKAFTALKDTNLQLGHEFSVFTGSYSRQPFHAAIEEVQKNIQK